MARGWSPIPRINHFIQLFRQRFRDRQYIVVQIRGDRWNVSDPPSRRRRDIAPEGVAHCLMRAAEGTLAFRLTGARFLPLPLLPPTARDRQ
jgi:hypothetical protein